MEAGLGTGFGVLTMKSWPFPIIAMEYFDASELMVVSVSTVFSYLFFFYQLLSKMWEKRLYFNEGGGESSGS